MPYPITRPQRKLLDTLKRLTEQNSGIAPTFEELAAELGVTHASVRSMAGSLAQRGWVRWIPKHRRTLQVIEDEERAA